ncbi:phosphoadenosine phosphosulfate reductase family protein [Candidatus Aerophobetes bacterium]|nr:phosphoadenosine phosphosulfate reductase family protein [Candidatus Aerophobetes bacterium]
MKEYTVTEARAKEIKERIEKSKQIMRETFEKFSPCECAVTWTGGKDSTTNLWIIRQVCVEDNLALPHVITIDEGDAFTEIVDVLINVSKKWGIDLKWLCNFDVLRACLSKLGYKVQVRDLNERNRSELKRIGFAEDSFTFEAESFAGNHLMKTVPLNMFIEKNNIKALFMAVRWDEHPARKDDKYFEEKESGKLQPPHTRVSPILHFTERDIWDNTHLHKLPYCPLYELGYRSLGVRSTTNPMEIGVPAWEQDLENTVERAGRRQDKEKAMDRLRKLGYM